MPRVAIVMPQLGESIAEATIVRLLIKAGDEVVADQELIEVETNKATMGLPTLCAGKIEEIRAKEGASYTVGTILGTLIATEEEITRTGIDTIETHEAKNSKNIDQSAEKKGEKNLHFAVNEDGYEEAALEVTPTIKGLSVPTGNMGAHYITPRMRARMDEMGLREADLSAIVGSGSGGRVTVEDLEKFLDYIQTWPSSNASPMRLAVADAMRRSWTRPLATVGAHILLDEMLQHRREQVKKPGPTLYLLRAFALALTEMPEVAGFLIGSKIVHPRSFDIGVAVRVEDGVVVPVIRNVDQKPLTDLISEYDDLVDRARRRRLTETDTRGGIATVTNFGMFGLTWGTPIPLPNETLILGIGAGVKKPVWSEKISAFIPATEADLEVTFDHRVVDGGGAGLLLKRIIELIQNPSTL
jgi:pyruvate/2-oxoglutarate dehydrogenase complex dihydrolipoamide acyltransferase (E2) component